MKNELTDTPRSSMKTVLITEDDRCLARLLVARLQRGGFATLLAHDLSEAISVITRQRVDAVILDLGLPEGCGTGVIQRMKAFNRTGPIPILVVSGTLDGSIPQTVLDMGADQFFAKPPDIDGIIASLHQLISRTSETVEKTELDGAALPKLLRGGEQVTRG